MDVDLQHHNSLSLSSFNTNSSPLVSNRNTPNFQGPERVQEAELERVKEAEMPYHTAGNFIMNPLAPPFVPRQEGQMIQGGQPGWGGQPGMLSLSLEHCRGTVSDTSNSNDGPQPVHLGIS